MATDAHDDPVLLPPPEDREWFHTELRAHLAQNGLREFAWSPIVVPDEQFFPDPFKGGAASVRRIARRLLRYAGLDLRVDLHLEDEETPSPFTASPSAWYEPGTPGVFELHLRRPALAEPIVLVAGIARAVASAWRVERGISKGTSNEEERRTDLTMVVLGFGLLLCQAALITKGASTGAFQASRGRSRLGMVGPKASAYLLALQSRVRELEGKELKPILKALGPNARAFFHKAREFQAGLELDSLLALPADEQWPEEIELGPLFAELPSEASLVAGDRAAVVGAEGSEDDEEEEPAYEDKGVRDSNEGKPVFRVERSMATRLLRASVFPVFMLGGMMAQPYMDMDIDREQITVIALCVAVVAFIVGSFLKDSRCSEPKCGAKIPPEAQRCPLCAGDVRGVIRHPKERLAAEEAWLESQSAEDARKPATESDSSGA